MKSKRTSAKVLITAMAILTIVPLLMVKNVKADSVPIMSRIYSWETVRSGYWSVQDFYFISDTPISNKNVAESQRLYIYVNTADQIPDNTWTWSLIESDGVLNYTQTQSSALINNKYYYRYKFIFELENCSYFHFRVKNTNSSFWNDSTTFASPGTYWRVSVDNGTYYKLLGSTNVSANVAKILNEIKNLNLNGITVDMTSTNQLLQDLLTLQTNNDATIIQLQQDIKALLEQQQNGTNESQQAIDNNDITNNELKTQTQEYEELNSTFESNFNESLQQINLDDISNQLNSFTAGTTWWREQMDNIYNSMGNFKFALLLPLIVGIALIMIGL